MWQKSRRQRGRCSLSESEQRRRRRACPWRRTRKCPPFEEQDDEVKQPLAKVSKEAEQRAYLARPGTEPKEAKEPKFLTHKKHEKEVREIDRRVRRGAPLTSAEEAAVERPPSSSSKEEEEEEEEEETSSLPSSSQLQYIDKVSVVALRQILRVPVVEVPQLELMADPRQCFFRGGAAVAVFSTVVDILVVPQRQVRTGPNCAEDRRLHSALRGFSSARCYSTTGSGRTRRRIWQLHIHGCFCRLRYISRCVPFGCRQAQDARHLGQYGPEGPCCSVMWPRSSSLRQ